MPHAFSRLSFSPARHAVVAVGALAVLMPAGLVAVGVMAWQIGAARGAGAPDATPLPPGHPTRTIARREAPRDAVPVPARAKPTAVRQVTASLLPEASPARERRQALRETFRDKLSAARRSAPSAPLPQATSQTAYDTAVALLMEGLPARADLNAANAAVEAFARGQISAGSAARDRIADADARAFVTWYAMQRGTSGRTAADIMAFAQANPSFPRAPLRKAAEAALLVNARDADDVLAFFADAPPRSSSGKAALAAAYAARGETARAEALLRAAWTDPYLNRSAENTILERFDTLLGEDDHKARIDALLMRDSRWKGTRSARLTKVRRMLPLLSEAERGPITARIAVFNRAQAARSAMAKHIGGRDEDWGFYLKRIQMHRRADEDETAWNLLLKAPTNPEAIVAPDDWWIERRVNAYAALYAGKPQLAYDLVADPGPLSVNPRKEALFMAGWLALRKLNNPRTALAHFESLKEAADGPLSRGRAGYWLGRAHEALGQPTQARAAYRAGAKEYFTYYGQLAKAQLEPDATTLPLGEAEPLTPEAIDRFVSSPAYRAVAIAARADLPSTTRKLITTLRRHETDVTQLALLAHLASTLGDTQMAVRVGKSGMARGGKLARWAYPTHAMPSFKALRPLPEQGIFYAIARQESEFNTLIVSGAGASGILQVMPATGRGVCRQYKIACPIQNLRSNPSFNAQLASAYIADQKDNHSGSYIMTFAAYNAGPGRVRYWVRNIGDPRNADVDPVDWVESIHIKETRQYVQKVLANLQVYRARLTSPDNAMRIASDLVRGRRGG